MKHYRNYMKLDYPFSDIPLVRCKKLIILEKYIKRKPTLRKRPSIWNFINEMNKPTL